jgi:dTDP-4-amino-4,6-dideoxygalactose transaminase
MTEANIPLVDLQAQYRSIKTEIDAAIRDVVENAAFIGGQRVSQFASDFAAAIGSEHCVPCANGTDAIYITLKMLGIGAGDEVVTVANSWISTSETISQTGATPVFVDIDEYFHLDPDLLEAAITPRTKAIVPVHIYGQPADMHAITEIASRHGLHVVEDCAQAHLATIGGRTVGTIGVAGTFSFYPGKNLGAYGDAGAIVSNDTQLAEKLRMYANHGALVKHEHQVEGINSRLDGIQAAVLSAKLPHLPQWTAARRSVAELYDGCLAGVDEVATPLRRPGTTHVFHLYVIRAERRDELAAYLKSKGIGCAIHYPTPLPLLPAYGRYGLRPEHFPAAHSAAKEILSLPIYPELEESEVERICTAIKRFYA